MSNAYIEFYSIYKSFFHHLINRICCCGMKCNLNQWVFFFIRFTYPCQGLYCRKFTASIDFAIINRNSY